jgi:tRNA threonylcarbamoyladenosine biosynthesis protein TsaE
MPNDADLPPNRDYPIELTLANPARTRSLGVQLGETLPAGSIILLEGDLGAGKTSLVQGIGAGLGVSELVDSPTFTLINEYLDGRIPLYHLDLYRLSPAEVEALYLETYWNGEMELGIVAIEWAERLPSKPSDFLQLQLTYDADNGRRASLFPMGKMAENFSFAKLRSF